LTKPKHKSYKAVAPTYLIMYERCPFQFKCARVDRVESDSEDSEILVFGNFVHYAMELYLAGGVSANDAFVRTHCERILTRYDPLLVAKAFDKAKRAYDWTVKQVTIILDSDETVYLSEMMFNCKNRFGVGISGRLDLGVYFPAKNVFKVYDFKGTYKVPSDDQLIFYYWGVKDKWPSVDVDLFYLWFTKRLYKKAMVNEAVEFALNERIVSMLSSVQAGDFPARKGKHCSWCGFKKYCPLFGGSHVG